MEGCSLASLAFRSQGVALALCLGCERSEGTQLAVNIGRPVEAILRARRAGHPLSVLQHAVPVAIPAGVLALRIRVGTHSLESGEFIATDPAIQQFFLACFGVEEPLSTFFHNRNWKRPV